MVTSQGAWSWRQGWLLRLEATDGRLGWGEAAVPPPPPADGTDLSGRPGLLEQRSSTPRLIEELERWRLETLLPTLATPLACALGMALAELDGLGSASGGGWLMAPPSALLLPAGTAAISALEEALAARQPGPARGGGDDAGPLANPPDGTSGGDRLTVKWKVASSNDGLERQVLEELLHRLPADGRLRLDANGGWDRATAWGWAERLTGEPRLEWLEQPLPPGDREGLESLARTLPVALDESLRPDPERGAGGWQGWQVRRPLAEGDPRPLLAALQAGTPRLMLSTALETGIGRRFLEHLAGLQALGPTPTAPGLAPGWRPRGALFSPEPETVWGAVG